MNLTCAIIDDEPLAVKLLENYVQRTPQTELVATYSGAVQAVSGLEEHPVDLIFCDIEMPELSGLQFAQMITDMRSRIVFTTAYSHYALQGWKADALDYLLKPVDYQDFLSAVQKAQRWFARELPKLPDTADGFFVKSDYKLVRVRFADVLYIEGLKDYIKIYVTTDLRPIISLISMRAVEAALPADQFMRIHRSYIVNVNHIGVIERGQIVFGDKLIPVSDSYRERFMAYIADHTLHRHFLIRCSFAPQAFFYTGFPTTKTPRYLIAPRGLFFGQRKVC